MHILFSHYKLVVRILTGTLLVTLTMLVILVAQIDLLWQQTPIAQPQPYITQPYIQEDKQVAIETKEEDIVIPVEEVLFEYIEITGGCGPNFEGQCLNVRSGPGKKYPVVARLRNGIVLKVDGKVEREERTWYKIVFDEWLRYPERVTSDWYVAADYVRIVLDEGARNLWDIAGATGAEITKRIVISRQEQMLRAYDGDELFMEEKISTGAELTPTPQGAFTIFRKTPSRYMQGPIPGITPVYFDLPGVPWNLYFTHQGAVIHGAYWHDDFGFPVSSGCVNLPTDKAKQLYEWAELGMSVIVQD